MQKTFSWLFVGMLMISATNSASAAVLIYNGDTTGGPTWNRPVAGSPPAPPLSGIGTATPYHVQQFQVDTAGSYDFLSTALVPLGWDNYTFLYDTSFNPLAQFTNVVIGNDDFPSIGLSGFNGIALNAGVNYFFVTTGFSDSDFGTFQNSITGPGNIVVGSPAAVPEPTTFAVLGLAGIAFVVGRRRLRREGQPSSSN